MFAFIQALAFRLEWWNKFSEQLSQELADLAPRCAESFPSTPFLLEETPLVVVEHALGSSSLF